MVQLSLKNYVKMGKLFHLLTITLVVSVNLLSGQDLNNSTQNVSDNTNSESKVEEQFAPKAVSSQGYKLEVIPDNSEEKGEDLKVSERQIYPSRSPGEVPTRSIDDYIRQDSPEYEKEDVDIGHGYLKERLSYDDVIQPKADISKVRDSFVGKSAEKSTSDSYHSPHYHEGPPGPHPLPHPPHLHHHDGHHDDHHGISGHTAGYGHGYHHHEQALKSKPLKPSVVYRDPKDGYNHHDKLRTLDKDHPKIYEKGHYGHDHKGHHDHHDHHDYHHGKGHYKPAFYDYDQSKIPECAHKNKYIYNLTFCLDDPHYPHENIIWALKEIGPHARKLLSDVTYQSADNLVSGLTRAEEEGYTYKHYFGASHSQNVHLDKYKPPYHGYTYSTDYFKKGGYICPSDIYYARPKRAMNTFGKWKVIVNIEHFPDHGWHGPHHDHHHHHHHQKSVDIGYGIIDKDHHHHDKHSHGPHHDHHDHHDDGHHHPQPHGYDEEYSPSTQSEAKSSPAHSIKKREYREKHAYTQTLRLEQCIYADAPCSYVDSHYHSKCIQKHNFVRLVAWTHHEGIHVDTFKMPIACSCHVHHPIHFYHESGHHGHKHGLVVPPVYHHK